VWELITRIETIPTWYDTWDAVETTSGEPFLRSGSTFRLIRHQRPVIAMCEVIEVTEHRRLQWTQSTRNQPTTRVTFDLISHSIDQATELRQTRAWGELGP
jgi:hypothetical protein